MDIILNGNHFFFPQYKLKYYTEIFYHVKDKKSPNNLGAVLLSVKIFHSIIMSWYRSILMNLNKQLENLLSSKTVTAGIWLECDLPKN